MFIKKVSYIEVKNMSGDLDKVKQIIDKVKDPQFIEIEIINGKGRTNLSVEILDSKLVFSFNNNKFVHFTIKHLNCTNKFFDDLEEPLKILEKHVELFNNYMKLLQQSL